MLHILIRSFRDKKKKSIREGHDEKEIMLISAGRSTLAGVHRRVFTLKSLDKSPIFPLRAVCTTLHAPIFLGLSPETARSENEKRIAADLTAE